MSRRSNSNAEEDAGGGEFQPRIMHMESQQPMGGPMLSAPATQQPHPNSGLDPSLGPILGAAGDIINIGGGGGRNGGGGRKRRGPRPEFGLGGGSSIVGREEDRIVPPPGNPNPWFMGGPDRNGGNGGGGGGGTGAGAGAASGLGPASGLVVDVGAGGFDGFGGPTPRHSNHRALPSVPIPEDEMDELVKKWKNAGMISLDIGESIRSVAVSGSLDEERSVLASVAKAAARQGILDGTPYITSLADLLRREDGVGQQQRVRTQSAGTMPIARLKALDDMAAEMYADLLRNGGEHRDLPEWVRDHTLPALPNLTKLLRDLEDVVAAGGNDDAVSALTAPTGAQPPAQLPAQLPAQPPAQGAAAAAMELPNTGVTESDREFYRTLVTNELDAKFFLVSWETFTSNYADMGPPFYFQVLFVQLFNKCSKKEGGLSFSGIPNFLGLFKPGGKIVSRFLVSAAYHRKGRNASTKSATIMAKVFKDDIETRLSERNGTGETLQFADLESIIADLFSAATGFDQIEDAKRRLLCQRLFAIHLHHVENWEEDGDADVIIIDDDEEDQDHQAEADGESDESDGNGGDEDSDDDDEARLPPGIKFAGGKSGREHGYHASYAEWQKHKKYCPFPNGCQPWCRGDDVPIVSNPMVQGLLGWL